MRSPSNIVCFTSYKHLVLVPKTIHQILRPEIRIGVEQTPAEKEAVMVNGIRAALDGGRNVVMFIDANDRTKPMRSLNHKVLEFFPTVQKQVVHIMEPTRVSEFLFQCLPATIDLATIVSMRESVLDNGPSDPF
jgi:hypothetical protein